MVGNVLLRHNLSARVTLLDDWAGEEVIAMPMGDVYLLQLFARYYSMDPICEGVSLCYCCRSIDEHSVVFPVDQCEGRRRERKLS